MEQCVRRVNSHDAVVKQMPEPLCRCTTGSAEGFWKLRQAPASGRIQGLRILNYNAAGVGEALTRAALALTARQ